MFYGKYKPENVDPILLCASTAAARPGRCCCHEHSRCPHAAVRQPGFPASWSLHLHEVPDDPANNRFRLPSPGRLQKTHPLHPYTARVEGLRFGTGSRRSSPAFLSMEAGKKPGGGEAWKPREKLHPSTLSSSTSQPSLLPPCKKAPPFTLYLELGQCSEPAGVIISLILCGKEEILALAFAFFLTALS